MGCFTSLSGKTFGRLTVISLHDRLNKKIRWNCTCRCGNSVIVMGSNLTTGHTISCGCAYDLAVRYCPGSGLLFHGKKLITKKDWRGYIMVRIRTKLHAVHRLAWEMMNGPIPGDMEIDHINRIKHDNRIANLRLVSHRDNMLNVANRVGSTSKYKGVSLIRRTGRWYASSKISGTSTGLGLYDTELEAAIAYNAHVLELGLHTVYLNKLNADE